MEFVIIMLLVCTVCGYLAHIKARNVALWVFIGFVFGVLGLVVLLFMPVARRCPECSEAIKSTARKCRHCGTILRSGL